MPVEGRPNLLIIFADQMRATAMGCSGNPDVCTVTLDQLARDGLRATHCFANNPVCCPSRATMWTGTYPTTHRVVSNDLPIRTDLPSLGTVTRDAGYRTGYIGKWHLDGVPRRKFTPPGPRRLGFDDWAAFNCSHDYFHTRYFRDTDEPIEVAGYEPVVQTDLALDFLRRRRDDQQPFCLALAWGPPHDPYSQVPEHYREMYDPQAIALPLNIRCNLDNPLARGLDCPRTLADYYAAVTALDDQLNRLVRGLDEFGLAERTIVVFTSDHGDMLWSHGWMKKQAPFDESIRVPLIVRGPGIVRGAISDEMFGLVDFFPTMLGLLGLQIPETCQGYDLSEILRGRAAPDSERSILIANQHSCDEAAMQAMPEWRGIRTKQYTYVETVPGEPWMLFDNLADPCQMESLLSTASAAGVKADLRDQLYVLLRDTSDPFVSGEQLLRSLNLEEAWRERNERINA